MSLAPPYRKCENGAKCFVTCPECEDLDQSFSNRLPPVPPPIMTGSDIEDLIARLKDHFSLLKSGDLILAANEILRLRKALADAEYLAETLIGPTLSSLRAENEELRAERNTLQKIAARRAEVLEIFGHHADTTVTEAANRASREGKR